MSDFFDVGITGGEPTLMGDLFPELLAILKRELPGLIRELKGIPSINAPTPEDMWIWKQ